MLYLLRIYILIARKVTTFFPIGQTLFAYLQKMSYLCIMEIVDEAIVLYLSKYSDKASILHVYSRQYGRMAYMVYGLHSKSGKARAALFEPMAHIEISATHIANKTIQQLRSAQLCYVANNTRTDMYKRTISLFLAEILFRTLRYPMSDEPLFQWLLTNIQALETSEQIANFHLAFMLELTEFLGITPDLEETNNPIFTQEDQKQLLLLVERQPIMLSRAERQKLLDKLCSYYEFHLTDFQTPKSLAILEELFD